MKSLKQLFAYLNDIDFEYVVLRNWENLPDSVELGEHSDLDLLVYDLEHFLEVIPEAKAEYPLPRVRYKLPVGDSYIYMDLRHLGDGYYPLLLEKKILQSREYNKLGFYTPNPHYHTIGLAYHAVHHKNYNAYKKWLGNTTIEELLGALKESDIGWVEPKDPSVGRFNKYFKGATSVVSKKDGVVEKVQTGWNEYNLVDNEFRILSKVKSNHFPKVLGKDEDSLQIEDCGELLTIDNLPDDWKFQLVQILHDLRANRVQHRDIKPDNLMVKDTTIKLIDFGWARFADEPEGTSPPSCLGYPYRPSHGFDDNFSMRKVIKELEHKLGGLND